MESEIKSGKKKKNLNLIIFNKLKYRNLNSIIFNFFTLKKLKLFFKN
jgi:hypothetical protein